MIWDYLVVFFAFVLVALTLIKAAQERPQFMENDQLKKDLKSMADGQAAHQVPDTKKVAKEALERIEDLEKKPQVKKDQFISNS